jgi:hypothetical protein
MDRKAKTTLNVIKQIRNYQRFRNPDDRLFGLIVKSMGA